METRRKHLPLYHYKVGLICPLFVELTAMRNMLDEEHAEPLDGSAAEGDQNYYVYGDLSNINVVIGSFPNGTDGTAGGASLVNDMIRTFRSISLLLLVGIGGGNPSHEHDIRLGDVVIGTPCDNHSGVVKYDHGRQTVEGFTITGYVLPPPKRFLSVITRMQSDHETQPNAISTNISQMLKRFPRLKEYSRQSPEKDKFFRSEYPHVPGHQQCQGCDESKLIPRLPRENPSSPQVHYGLIASGDRVMKDGIERDKISASLKGKGALCFEMEAGGVTPTARCLVIRGISDYSDSHKNDDWQKYAAATAAGVAKELLSYFSHDKGMKGVIWDA